MPFQSEKQRRYLWANEPEIAREWTDRYGASEGGITRLPFQQGNWANWVGNNPWKSGAAVVGPLAAAAGVQSMQDINTLYQEIDTLLSQSLNQMDPAVRR